MASSSSPRIRAAVLGPVAVESRDGYLVEPAGALAKSLIVALVLARGRTLSVQALVDDLWEDDPPRQEKAALQTLVSRVRGVCAEGLLESGHGGYALALDPLQTDLGQASELAESAGVALAAGDHAAADHRAASALGLWRSEPGAELAPGAPATELSERAASLRTRLVRLRAESLLGLGRSGDAVDLLQPLAEAAPLDEDVRLLLMRALAAAGRRNDALGVFAAFRATLRDQLGTGPSAAMVELNTRLLRADREAEPTASGSSPHVTIGLRTPPNDLLGRENDVIALQRSIRSSRLTTILGPGGIGKTRLAQEVGGREVERTPRVVVVELASVRSGEDITTVLASTLGIREASARLQVADSGVRIDVRERILAALGGRETLLIMDNCEHVADAAAAWIADILATTANVRVLATSRAPLTISGESAYQLEPLATSDDGGLGPAVTLFMERARAARPGAVLPVDAISRLCTRLDGLPLAIELAAARVRSMSVEEIERRLNNRFALLRGGERTAPERHRTLMAVIDWSWNLLSEPERRLLRRLSRFPDGFSADAAQVVGADDGAEVIDDLDGLVAQSLAAVSERPDTGLLRYRMLETVREFGDIALTEAGEAELVRARMIVWAAGFAGGILGDLSGSEEARTFAIVTAEQDNLVAILRAALDTDDTAAVILIYGMLAYYWTMRGAHSDVAAFAPAVLKATRGYRPDAAHRAAAVIGYTITAGTFFFGDRREALRARSRLRSVMRDGPTGDARLDALSGVILAADDMQNVLALIAEHRASSNPEVSLLGHLFNAQIAENAGDIELSLADSRRAYELAIQEGSLFSQNNAAQSLTELYSQSGRPEEALRWADTTRRGLTALYAYEDLQQVDWTIAMNEISLGRVEGARTTFQSFASEDEEKLGFDFADLRSIGWSGLAEIALYEGRTDEGLELYRRAIDVFGTGPRRRSPWYSIIVAATLTNHTRERWPDHAWLDGLARRLRMWLRASRRVQGGYVDLPVAGASVLGLSDWLLSPGREPVSDAITRTGLRLLVLSGLLNGRQDLPSLHRDRHEAAAVAAHGEAALAEARAAVGGLSREEAVDRAFELLTDRALRAPFVGSPARSCPESAFPSGV